MCNKGWQQPPSKDSPLGAITHRDAFHSPLKTGLVQLVHIGKTFLFEDFFHPGGTSRWGREGASREAGAWASCRLSVRFRVTVILTICLRCGGALLPSVLSGGRSLANLEAHFLHLPEKKSSCAHTHGSSREMSRKHPQCLVLSCSLDSVTKRTRRVTYPEKDTAHEAASER